HAETAQCRAQGRRPGPGSEESAPTTERHSAGAWLAIGGSGRRAAPAAGRTPRASQEQRRQSGSERRLATRWIRSVKVDKQFALEAYSHPAAVRDYSRAVGRVGLW